MPKALLFLYMPLVKPFLSLVLSLTLLVSCDRSNSGTQGPEAFLPYATEATLNIEQWKQTSEDFQGHSIYSALNQEPFGQFFKKYPELQKGLEPKGPILLAYSRSRDSLFDFTLISESKKMGFQPDSMPNLNIDSLSLKKKIRKYSLGHEVFFFTEIDGIHLISTSGELLENIRSGNTLKDQGLLKALKVKKNKPVSFTTSLIASKNERPAVPWGSYASFELQLLPDGLVSHGIVMDSDSLGERLSVFRGQLPQESQTPKIVMSSAKRAMSFAFNNLDSLRKRLSNRNYEKGAHPLFETANELSWVKTASSSYCALNSLDSNLSWESLAASLTELESYRDIPLYRLSEETLLFEPFEDFAQFDTYQIAFPWNNFLVFAVDENQAHELISGFLNKSVLSETSQYQHISTYLAQSASLVFYEMDGNWNGLLAQLFHSEASQLKGNPLMAVQLIYDRDFAHLNIAAKSAGKEFIATGPVQQLASIRLDNDLMRPPKFFSNHNTGGKDIVVQDLSNQLYLISANGKILWKKKLDGPIQGAIHEVDLLRNGKKQMAFSTENSVYILDRNGNPVAPFPKKFRDPITQPLSVFDYDNNRKYRFVVVQNDRMYMYDTQGQSVKGFNFEKAGSKIVLPPQHIRIGNKDYITVAEASGKLNILNRVGKIRVPVNHTMAFSELPIEKEGSNFVVITSDKRKVSIDQNGAVNPQKLDVSDSYWFSILGSTKLTLDDNLMRINGKLTELPVGYYSKPQLLSIGKNLYAAITETKENTVYVYSKNGDLLPHFPVYGTSEIDMGDANRNNLINILVQGEKDEVLLYQLPKQ